MESEIINLYCIKLSKNKREIVRWQEIDGADENQMSAVS